MQKPKIDLTKKMTYNETANDVEIVVTTHRVNDPSVSRALKRILRNGWMTAMVKRDAGLPRQPLAQ